MNWDDLQTVLALARHRTLSGAAGALGVRHTTVARRLQGFEDTLGVRLFERTADGLTPTGAGEDLVETAQRMEEEALHAEARVLGRDLRLLGRVRLTTIDFLAVRYADVFASFSRRFPEVDLEIEADHRVANLAHREADVALRMTNKPDEGLVGRKVARNEYAVYGARALAEEVGRDAPLDRFPWVTWHPALDAPGTRAWMARHVGSARIAAYAVSPLVLNALVRAGVGLAHLHVHDGEADPALVRVRDREPGWGMDLWLLTHPHIRQSARIRAFTEHLFQAISATGDAAAGAGLPWAEELL